jgi:hypothetical protein
MKCRKYLIFEDLYKHNINVTPGVQLGVAYLLYCFDIIMLVIMCL